MPTPDLPELPRPAPRAAWLVMGAKDWLADQVVRIDREQNAQQSPALWVTGEGEPAPSLSGNWDIHPGRQLSRLLGSTYTRIVLDWRTGWNLNHLSRVMGALAGGGQILFLLREPAAWNDCYAWHPAVGGQATFFRHWFTAWQTAGATRVRPPRAVDLPEPAIIGLSRAPERPWTPDQQTALDQLVERLQSGPVQKEPWVVTGSRGVGKSTLIALLARALVRSGKPVLMTAALADQVRHLARISGHGDLCREWQQLNPAQLSGTIVLVDEAAMLGTERLRLLWRKAGQCVFSSTTEGYEGSGQGLLLRFLPWLAGQTERTGHLRLTRPVRWDPEDAVSRAYRDSTLNSAVMSGLPVHHADRPDAVEPFDFAAHLEPDDPSGWVPLLTESHYQTRPEDLRQCVDDPAVRAWAIRSGQRVIALVVALAEPPLPDTLARAVYTGTRRPASQLAKQSLVGQLGQIAAAEWSGLRIWRLAVRPEWRRQGLGRQLIEHLLQWAGTQGLQYVATSYGATQELIAFWRCAGFRPVRLGHKVDPASGSRSLLEICWCAAGDPEPAWLRSAGRSLGEALFPFPAQSNTLQSAQALAVLAARLPEPDISGFDRQRLRHWAESHQPESALQPLLARALWALLSAGVLAPDEEAGWLVSRYWLQISWQQIQAANRLPDWRPMRRTFRAAVADHFAGEVL